jgi:hypothetical protein
MNRIFSRARHSPIRRLITTQTGGGTWKLEPLEPTRKNTFINSIIGVCFVGVLIADGYYLYQNRSEPKKNVLLSNEFTMCQLKDIVQVTHDTFLYRINAKSTGSNDVPFHIVLKDDSCQIARNYTPIYMKENEIGLLIKHYPDGAMSSMLQHVKIGDYLHIRGPMATMAPYHANTLKHLSMV